MFFYLISCVASHLKFKDIIVFKMNRMIVLLYFVTFIVFSSGVTESNFDAIFTSSLDDNGTVVMTKQHGSGYSDDVITSVWVVIVYVVVGLSVGGGIIFFCYRLCVPREVTPGFVIPLQNPFGNQIIMQSTANGNQPASPPPGNYPQFQNYPSQQPPGYFETQPPMPPDYYALQSSQGQYAQKKPEVPPPKKY